MAISIKNVFAWPQASKSHWHDGTPELFSSQHTLQNQYKRDLFNLPHCQKVVLNVKTVLPKWLQHLWPIAQGPEGAVSGIWHLDANGPKWVYKANVLQGRPWPPMRMCVSRDANVWVPGRRVLFSIALFSRRGAGDPEPSEKQANIKSRQPRFVAPRHWEAHPAAYAPPLLWPELRSSPASCDLRPLCAQSFLKFWTSCCARHWPSTGLRTGDASVSLIGAEKHPQPPLSCWTQAICQSLWKRKLFIYLLTRPAFCHCNIVCRFGYLFHRAAHGPPLKAGRPADFKRY